MAKGFKDFMAEANQVIETCPVEDALRLQSDDDWIFVDVRDAAEIAESGKIAGAVQASRGMLEFKIDPASPLHDATFASGKKFVFYCGTGGRSALATKLAVDMGLGEVMSLAGGFKAWKEADGAIEPL